MEKSTPVERIEIKTSAKFRHICCKGMVTTKFCPHCGKLHGNEGTELMNLANAQDYMMNEALVRMGHKDASGEAFFSIGQKTDAICAMAENLMRVEEDLGTYFDEMPIGQSPVENFDFTDTAGTKYECAFWIEHYREGERQSVISWSEVMPDKRESAVNEIRGKGGINCAGIKTVDDALRVISAILG